MTCIPRACVLEISTKRAEIWEPSNWLCGRAYLRRDMAAQCASARAPVPMVLALVRMGPSANVLVVHDAKLPPQPQLSLRKRLDTALQLLSISGSRITCPQPCQNVRWKRPSPAPSFGPSQATRVQSAVDAQKLIKPLCFLPLHQSLLQSIGPSVFPFPILS
jgi:hypothetical protein